MQPVSAAGQLPTLFAMPSKPRFPIRAGTKNGLVRDHLAYGFEIGGASRQSEDLVGILKGGCEVVL